MKFIKLFLAVVLPTVILQMCLSLVFFGGPLKAEVVFQASDAFKGSLLIPYALIYIVLTIASGHLSDRLGRRAVLCLGSLLFSGGSLAFAYAPAREWMWGCSLLLGCGSALFWPSMEAFTAEALPRSMGIGQKVGVFNLSWTGGMAAAHFLGGQIAARNLNAIFLLAAGLTAVLPLMFIFGKGDGHLAEKQELIEANDLPPNPKAVMLTTWIGHCIFWGIAATIQAVFPSLLFERGIEEAAQGALLGLYSAGMLAAFLCVGFLRFWRYNFPVFLGSQVVGAAAVAAIALSGNATVMAAAFLVFGFMHMMPYTCSLTYGMELREGRGLSAGIHEALQGASRLIFPISLGFTGDFDPRLPYFLGAACLMAGVLLQAAIHAGSLKNGAAN